MSDDESNKDGSSDDSSEPEPILVAQVAANTEYIGSEDDDVEVLSESDDE